MDVGFEVELVGAADPLEINCIKEERLRNVIITITTTFFKNAEEFPVLLCLSFCKN